jgi:hypothetical protein
MTSQFTLYLVLFVCSALILRACVIHRLKTRHTLQWRQLGEPSLIDLGIFEPASRAATIYFVSFRWVKLRDPILLILAILYVSAVAAFTFLLVVDVRNPA